MKVCKTVLFSGMHLCCVPPHGCILLLQKRYDRASSHPSGACPPCSGDRTRCSALSEQPARQRWGLHSVHSSHRTPVALLLAVISTRGAVSEVRGYGCSLDVSALLGADASAARGACFGRRMGT